MRGCSSSDQAARGVFPGAHPCRGRRLVPPAGALPSAPSPPAGNPLIPHPRRRWTTGGTPTWAFTGSPALTRRPRPTLTRWWPLACSWTSSTCTSECPLATPAPLLSSGTARACRPFAAQRLITTRATHSLHAPAPSALQVLLAHALLAAEREAANSRQCRQRRHVHLEPQRPRVWLCWRAPQHDWHQRSDEQGRVCDAHVRGSWVEFALPPLPPALPLTTHHAPPRPRTPALKRNGTLEWPSRNKRPPAADIRAA